MLWFQVVCNDAYWIRYDTKPFLNDVTKLALVWTTNYFRYIGSRNREGMTDGRTSHRDLFLSGSFFPFFASPSPFRISSDFLPATTTESSTYWKSISTWTKSNVKRLWNCTRNSSFASTGFPNFWRWFRVCTFRGPYMPYNWEKSLIIFWKNAFSQMFELVVPTNLYLD